MRETSEPEKLPVGGYHSTESPGVEFSEIIVVERTLDSLEQYLLFFMKMVNLIGSQNRRDMGLDSCFWFIKNNIVWIPCFK